MDHFSVYNKNNVEAKNAIEFYGLKIDK